jgi:hypothetical protein
MLRSDDIEAFGDFFGHRPGSCTVCAVYAAWTLQLADYLTGRLKLVAPSIVPVVFMALLAAAAAINKATYLSGLKPHSDFPLYVHLWLWR